MACRDVEVRKQRDRKRVARRNARLRAEGKPRRNMDRAREYKLNPVENVWLFMRDNLLSNRVFQSYDDILDHCCQAWTNLVSQPMRIASIGTRKWAHGF